MVSQGCRTGSCRATPKRGSTALKTQFRFPVKPAEPDRGSFGVPRNEGLTADVSECTLTIGLERKTP
jgi:hypothetical protein